MGQAASFSSSSSSSCRCGDEIRKQTADGHSIVITKKKKDLTLCLPDECLATVFGKLGCHDNNSCSMVCKRWKLVDSKSRQRLVLFASTQMSTCLPALLSRFSSVSILSLKCSRKHLSIDDHCFSTISILLVSLKKLKIKGCVDVSDDGLVAFASHRPIFLSKISFASCGFSAKGLISLLINCPSLHHLTLKRLRNLDAHNIPLCYDNSINTKQSHIKLQRLCLKDLHNARIFVPLLSAASKVLKTLIVCRSSGNWDKVMQSVAQERITAISEIQMENVQMGDEGLMAISCCCPDLQVLQLSRTIDCTDGGLCAVANSCKNLRKLHIDAWSRFGGRSIGDEGVLNIAKQCSNLRELVLMGIPVTIASLTALASNCRTLERLALCNTETVGDPEMAVIAEKFTALKKLCIKKCPISESGIEAIGDGCPNLVKLKVKMCRGISERSVRKVRLKRSWVVVSVDVMVHEEDDTNVAGAGEQGILTQNTITTHVVCSSTSALFLRSTFQNAFQFGKRRPN